MSLLDGVRDTIINYTLSILPCWLLEIELMREVFLADQLEPKLFN